jgi:hypothetical protein
MTDQIHLPLQSDSLAAPFVVNIQQDVVRGALEQQYKRRKHL